MPLKQVTKALPDTDVKNFRSLQDLQAVSFVIQLDNKNYALSTAMLKIATVYQLEIGQVQDRLAKESTQTPTVTYSIVGLG